VKQWHGLIISSNGKILVTLLVVAVVIGILLTPLGPFETRPISALGSPGWPVTFITGVILNFACIILLFSRARTTSILAGVASVLYIVPILADQAGLFLPRPPPPAIPALEIITIVVEIAVLFFALSVHRESTVKKLPFT
jgi:hypothetical protein